MKSRLNISLKMCLQLVLVGIVIPKFQAQQVPQYTQWAAHQFALNPAHAGIKKCIDLHTLYRSQWTGFSGAPKSGFFTLSAPLATRQKELLSARYGLGARMETDKIGQFASNRFNLAFASHFNFSPVTRLSLGVSAGLIQMGYDPSSAITIQPDPSVMSESNFILPDASFGAWWNGENYYFGLIMQNLIPNKWENIGSNSSFRLHTTANGGVRYAFSESLTLLPGFIIKIPPRGPAAFDLNFLADINNEVGFGVGYRNTDALLFLVNLKIFDQFSIQYSFDFVLSPLRKTNIYSHEFSLTFTTCKSKRTGAVNCPLF